MMHLNGSEENFKHWKKTESILRILWMKHNIKHKMLLEFVWMRKHKYIEKKGKLDNHSER